MSLQPPTREPAEREPRVLVIEDNATDRLFITEILRARGYDVEARASGEAGLEALKQSPVEIVLLDLFLPGISGAETCRRLRADPETADAFVIVITGSADDDAFREVLEAGADDFLRKPLDPPSFFVRLAIAKRRIQAQIELRQAESELVARRRELEVLFRNVQDVFFSVDLSHDRLIQISPSAEALFGHPLPDLTGPAEHWRAPLQPVLDRLAAEAPDSWDEPLILEYAFDRPSGRRCWVRTSVQVHEDAVAGIRRADGVTVDVTSEHRARTELKERNDELAALYRLAELTLAVQGLDEGYSKILELVSELTGCDVVAVEHLDHDKDRLVMTAARGIPEAADGSVSIPLHQTLSGLAISSGQPVVERDPASRSEHAHPVLKKLELAAYSAFPLFAAGRAFGTLLIADTRPRTLDATFLRLGTGLAATVATYVEHLEGQESVRRSEQRQRAVAGELRQANRELEAFAYSVSHDLRAPLRTMQGFSHALLQNFGDQLPDEARDYLDRIIASGAQSEKLISDLLAYSRVSFEQLKNEPVELTSVLEAARDQVQSHFAGSDASIVVEEPLPVVSGNVTILVQVVANLLTNAVKFVPDGRKPEIRVWAEESAKKIRLWVEDNGIGVPPGQEERIFGVFERLDGEVSRPGTGIGLAIVRRGMQRIGGDAGVRSQPEGGSAFWIEAGAAQERPWRPRRRGRSS